MSSDFPPLDSENPVFSLSLLKFSRKSKLCFFISLSFVLSEFLLNFAAVILRKMSHDISQPVPQGSYRAEDAENSRIAAITDELERLCAVHEAQLGDSQAYVSRFETEQRAAEQMAKANGYWIPMMELIH